MMDLNNRFIHNEIKHLGENLNAMKDTLILIQGFLQAQFGNKFTRFCESQSDDDGLGKGSGQRRSRKNEVKKDPLDLDNNGNGNGEEEEANPVIFNMLDDDVTGPSSPLSSCPTSPGEEGDGEGDDYEEDPTYIPPQIQSHPDPVTVKAEPILNVEDNSVDLHPSSGPGEGGGPPAKKRRGPRRKFTKIASFSTFEEATNFVKHDKDGGGVWCMWKKYESPYPGDRYYYECKWKRKVKRDISIRRKHGVEIPEDMYICRKQVYIMKPRIAGRKVEVHEQNPEEAHPCLTDCTADMCRRQGVRPEIKKMIEDIYAGGLKKAKYILLELKERGVDVSEGDEIKIRSAVQYMRRTYGDTEQETNTTNFNSTCPPPRKRKKRYTPTGNPRGRPTKYPSSTVSSTTTVEQNSLLPPDVGGGWGNLMGGSGGGNPPPPVLPVPGQGGSGVVNMNLSGIGHPYLLPL